MGRFIKENWIWIAAPIVLVSVAVVALLVLDGGGDQTAPFTYSLF